MRGTRTWSAAVGAAATLALASGCAPGTLDDDPASTDAGASASLSASPSPTQEPVEPTEPVTFTTQNGTTSFTLPAGWTVRDTSSLSLDHDGEDVWSNSLVLVDASGADRITYLDPTADGVGAAVDAFDVVQALPLQHRIVAAAWWVSYGAASGTTTYSVQAALVEDPSNPSAVIAMSGGLATVAGVLEGIPECAAIDSEAAAVACLESDAVTETLQVLARYEPHDVPDGAMP